MLDFFVLGGGGHNPSFPHTHQPLHPSEPWLSPLNNCHASVVLIKVFRKIERTDPQNPVGTTRKYCRNDPLIPSERPANFFGTTRWIFRQNSIFFIFPLIFWTDPLILSERPADFVGTTR